MNLSFFKLILFGAIVACLASCNTHKNLIYLQDAHLIGADSLAQTKGIHESRIMANDILSGSTYNGHKCGTIGEIGVLSFNGNKIITTSGGGALVSKDSELVKKSRFLATQARDNAPYYQHSQIGYNYRMSNIVAGVGRGQMEVLPARVNKRREINKFYREQLSNVDGISFQSEPDSRFLSNYWLTSILLDPSKIKLSPNELRLALEEENIESRLLWKPMHLQPIFEKYPYFGDGTSDELFNQGLCLPSSSILTEDDILRVCSAIKNVCCK